MIVGVDVGEKGAVAVLLDDAGAVIAESSAVALGSNPVPSLREAVLKLPAAPRAEATQLAINARITDAPLREGDGLIGIGLIRLGGSTGGLPPLAGWPAELRRRILVRSGDIDGAAGSGPRCEQPLDRGAVTRFGCENASRLAVIAVAGVFSPRGREQEREAREVLREALGPDMRVLLSTDLGSYGRLERENAVALAASLTACADSFSRELAHELPRLGLASGAKAFVARHDGTLASLEYLNQQPGVLLGAGPASTVLGGGALLGVDDAVVVDCAARSLRLGSLSQGRLLETSRTSHIRGIPVSLAFPELADVEELSGLHDAAELVRPGAAPAPLILAGQGSQAIPVLSIPGWEVLRPQHSEAAGAVGAAISPVGGRAERLCDAEPVRRGEAAEAVLEEARISAILAGADPQELHTTLAPSVPVPYLKGTVLLRAQAVGRPPL